MTHSRTTRTTARSRATVEFPARDSVAYQIDDEDEWNMIHMSSAVTQPTELGHKPSQAFQASVASAPQPER